MARIGEVVERIHELEKARKSAAERIKESENRFVNSEVFLEDRLVTKVAEKAVDLDGLSVAGVDGGLVKKEYAGVDIVVSRAVASFFEYSGGSLSDSYTLPKIVGSPEVDFIESPLDIRSFNLSSSYIRLKKEVGRAIRALEENPDIVLMDGSIIPQYAERPEKGTEARKLYDSMVEKFRELLKKSEEKEVLLAGVIEDSRSKRLSEAIGGQAVDGSTFGNVLKNTRDTNLLEYLMDKGFRTSVMSFAKDYEKHMVLNDIGEKGKEVYSFYLKTAEEATPVRIDFFNILGVSETADKVSEILIPLCCYSSTYGIPSVLVDADSRAKLSSKDIEMLESKISSVIGPLPGLKGLRRNNRPF